MQKENVDLGRVRHGGDEVECSGFVRTIDRSLDGWLDLRPCRGPPKKVTVLGYKSRNSQAA